MNKVLFCDICYTLVPFSTTNKFLMFLSKKNIILLTKVLFHKIWNFLKLNKLYNISEASLYKGITKSKLDKFSLEFCNQYFLKNMNNDVVKFITNKKKEGYIICLTSAAFNYPLKHLKNDLFDIIIYSELEVNHKCTGKIIGKLNKGETKIKNIKSKFQKIKIDHSISISDCISDLPLLKFTSISYAYTTSSWPVENDIKYFNE